MIIPFNFKNLGLFSQAIELSGSLFGEWACSNRVIQETEKLASLLKCDLADSKKMKKCLKEKSVGEILDAQDKIVNCKKNLILLFLGYFASRL